MRHGGEASIRCRSATTDERRGGSVTIQLDQKEPAPILVTGPVPAGPSRFYRVQVE